MNRNIIFKLLVVFILLTLSSCDKNKIYYPADFYQGTLQTCIDKNNRYVSAYRYFPHIDKNSIFFFNDFPAHHLIEYNFHTNKMDTLFSQNSSEMSPSLWPSDFYAVNRDSILISTIYKYFWSNKYPNHIYLPSWKINLFIEDTIRYDCYGSLGCYSEMTIIDGKYLVTPVAKTGIWSDNGCSLYSQWATEYDELKDWNRNHYVRFKIENDTTISEVKLFCSGSWISSHPTDVYYNSSQGIGNIYSPKKERFYFFYRAYIRNSCCR